MDATTLPKFQAGTQTRQGDRFIVKGRNFDLWPSEIVLTWNDEFVVEGVLPSPTIFRLVERTDTELIFEVTEPYFYNNPHEWVYFATPFSVPRSLLSYSTF